MATEDTHLASIDAKLSALLRAVIAEQSHGTPTGPPGDAEPRDLAEHVSAMAALLEGTGPGASPGRSVSRDPSRLTSGEDVLAALDEVSRLLALSLRRKRGFVEVVAELDGVGISRARIGELLGESPSRVDAALVTYDRRSAKRGRKGR